MGKYDLDDLLRDLGEPDEGAPREPGSDEAGAAADGAEAPADAAPADAAAPASEPESTRPEAAPRPPDLTGGGLGSAIDGAGAGSVANALQIRPDDGLLEITGVESVGTVPPDLCDCLLERGIIDQTTHEDALRVRKQSPGKSITSILVESGTDEPAVQEVVAELNDMEFRRVDPGDEESFCRKSFERLGSEFCEQHFVLPLRKSGGHLDVATAAPDDVFLIDDVRRRLGVSSVHHVLVPAEDIKSAIELQNATDAEDYDVEDLLSDVDEDDVEVVEEELDDADATDAESSPVVRYVNHIIQTALKEGASDIHIEPGEKNVKVRFRIDGVLFEMMSPPKKMHAALTSRLKIMANLDIAERRLPQDGRIRVTVMNRKLDLRVSTVPTPKGEKTVMRILDNRAVNVSLDQLGFSVDTLTIWKKQIEQPHGIILVTGPTGSGKTTTLYASLQQLDLRRLNVSTVEDPVEYNISNITQIQTHDKIGMTFGKALKALLRQDPDVIMVGEIRDMETATIATQASMTGHLVLSTLHTNDAPSSITRLINIGLEPFLVAAAVNAVLAQRLVRRICSNCATEVEPVEEMRDFLEMNGIALDKVKNGKGCGKCRQTGYSGRNGLYELLVLDDFMRDAVARNPNVTEFRRQCTERGMVTLREDGMQKVANGVTTVEEILRVTDSTI